MPFGVKKSKKDVPWSGDLEYDYIMWIDSDMVWEPEQVFELLKHDKDMVSAITMIDEKRCNCVELGDKKDYELMDYDKLGDGLTEVETCGFAFLLIKRGVFEKVGFPWFRPVYSYYEEIDTEKAVSEDIGFCILAREKGVKVYADPNIIVGHEKRRILGGDYEQPTW
jgi:GT2 family glycosyltransferase